MKRLALAPLLALLLAGCDGDCDKCVESGLETGEDSGGVDADGDGFPESLDCDDQNAMINPDAEEDCDALDNDCDQEIDEGVTTTYYRDADGDGFGDDAVYAEACEPVGDYLPSGGDCDDADRTIYPGADEVCDGVDNNCDDLTDEGLDGTYYVDGDGDGYGDPTDAVTACEASPGVVSDASDCDDADGDINPAASERCGDGVDQDCDTVDPTCSRYEGEIAASEADAELMGEAGEYAGARVRPAGDMDGDGDDDLLVELYAAGPDGADWSGAVALVPGPVSGVVALADVASSTLYGASAGEYAGWGLARGEDLDGDGAPDLAIGAYGRWDASAGVGGGCYVVYGPPPAGASSLADADGLILADDPNLGMLGYDMSSSEDLTGDGVGDVVLGSYGSSTDSWTGAAWVVPGPVDGTVTLADAIVVSGRNPIDLAGNGLDGVGDVNGDGSPDLVVGAHGDDTAGDAAGAAGVFYGPLDADLTLGEADRLLLGEKADEEFSRNGVNGRGDVDGDGVDDLLVSAFFGSPSGTYSGAAYLFAGDASASGSTSATDATALFYGASSRQFFGRSLDIAGDVDADGLDDVLVGGQGWDGGATDAGAASLFYGPLSGTRTMGEEDAIFLGGATNEGLGISVAGVGDTSGDGRADLLLGAWFNADNGSYAGAAFLFSGG